MSGAYLDKSEFADDVERVISDDDFTVMVNPALTTEQIVNTRCRFVPRVQLTRPATPSPRLTTLHSPHGH